MRVCHYPHGETGEVRDYLQALRRDARTLKAAVRLDLDLQTLEEFWPETLNVTVRGLKGWACGAMSSDCCPPMRSSPRPRRAGSWRRRIDA